MVSKASPDVLVADMERSIPDGSTFTSLDLTRLENIRHRGNKIEAACPACREAGRDRSGNHLVIFERGSGRFGCVACPGDKEHRKRIRTLIGIDTIPPMKRSVIRPAQGRPSEPKFIRHTWKELEIGTENDFRRLSNLREIGVEGLKLAGDRGVLRFFTCQRNGRCWSVTDDRRHIRQDRRLDGEWMLLVRGGKAKSRSIGRPQSWPIGLAAATNFPVILFVEGAPDLLAAHHLIWSEDREGDTAAVMLTGTPQHIHETLALPMFAGKRVRIFPDADEAGQGFNAGSKWEKQLRRAGAHVDAFDLRGLTTLDGRRVKDVNDFLQVDPDIWETDPDVRASIPAWKGGAKWAEY